MEGHTQEDNAFWAVIEDVELCLPAETQEVMAVAESLAVRKVVDWLNRGELEPAVFEEVRSMMIEKTAADCGLTIEQSERAFNLCAWMRDETERHGQA